MKIHVLQKEQFIPRPLHEVFAFFEKPENLTLITPADLHFKILNPPPITMKAGLRINYKIQVLNIPLRWTSLISVYDAPHRFIDEQVRGPYAYWHHLHTFEAVEGGTLTRDEVHYAIPLGPIGNFLQKFFIQKNLERIFAYRSEKIKELFGHLVAEPPIISPVMFAKA